MDNQRLLKKDGSKPVEFGGAQKTLAADVVEFFHADAGVMADIATPEAPGEYGGELVKRSGSGRLAVLAVSVYPFLNVVLCYLVHCPTEPVGAVLSAPIVGIFWALELNQGVAAVVEVE